MARFPKLSALLCVALLTSVSGVAAQAAPETPDGSTVASDGSVQTPAAQPTEGAPALAEEAPPAPAQTSEESAPAPEALPQAAPAATQVEFSAVAAAQTGADTDPKSDKEKAEDALKQATCGSGSMALSSGGCTKPWRLIGYGEYRSLVVRDEHPQNDRSLRFFLQGNYRLLKKHNVQVWGRIRYMQTFNEVVNQQDHAALLQDGIVGADYMHQMSFDEQGWKGANLTFQHRLSASIPSKYDGREKELRTRLTALERVRLSPIPQVYVGPDLVASYANYKYAGQEGPEGGPNPLLDLSGTLVAEYYPWESEKYGAILLGIDGGLVYTMLYEGREGETADTENRWRQNYAWDLYAYYMPRQWLWAGISLSNSMPVMRDGVVNPDFVNRDATTLSFSVTGLY